MSRSGLAIYTPARVQIDRTGHSLKTADLLTLRSAHAQARDAVHTALQHEAIAAQLNSSEYFCVRSAADDRRTYLQRPDLGRRLVAESRNLLDAHRGCYDIAFVIADGLSASAAQTHAVPLVQALLLRLEAHHWTVAPIIIATQARVALGDEIAISVGAQQVLVLIGERPGMSSPDSLGAYLTWEPRPDLTDADRNCVSNIREAGLSYAEAAHRLWFLMSEARTRRVSGVPLKEEAGQFIPPGSPSMFIEHEKAE